MESLPRANTVSSGGAGFMMRAGAHFAPTELASVGVSGYKIQQDLSQRQGFAKTMTSALIIPSVLCLGLVNFQGWHKVLSSQLIVSD